MDESRRAFLIQSGQWIVLTGAAAIAWDAVAAGAPETAANYEMTRHWWAMIIDIDKCIGCGTCVRSCKAENNVPLEPEYFRTWVERYVVNGSDLEHPTVESPNGGYDGFEDLPDLPPNAKTFFVPKMCNHCTNGPCVQVCPVGATFFSPDGVVLVDKERCLGCRYCIQACPYGGRFIDPRTNTVDKCTLCYHRITKGLLPACVETCPTGARMLGDLKNPADPIHAYLKTHNVQVLKPQMATGAKAFYHGVDGSVR